MNSIKKAFNEHVKGQANIEQFIKDCMCEFLYPIKDSYKNNYFDFYKDCPCEMYTNINYNVYNTLIGQKQSNYCLPYDITQICRSNCGLVILSYPEEDYKLTEQEFYTKLYSRCISFIPFFYDKLKDYFSNVLNIDRSINEIEIYKVYDSSKTQMDNDNHSTLNFATKQELAYIPFVMVGYKDELPDGSNEYFANNEDEYTIACYSTYRTIISPYRNLVYHNDTQVDSRPSYIDSRDYKFHIAFHGFNGPVHVDRLLNEYVSRLYDDKGNIIDDIANSSRARIYRHFKDIRPSYISFHNLVNGLSIAVKNKKTNTYDFICNIFDRTFNLKVVNECTGFNDVIEFKRRKNSHGLVIRNADESASYENICDEISKLKRERLKMIYKVEYDMRNRAKDYAESLFQIRYKDNIDKYLKSSSYIFKCPAFIFNHAFNNNHGRQYAGSIFMRVAFHLRPVLRMLNPDIDINKNISRRENCYICVLIENDKVSMSLDPSMLYYNYLLEKQKLTKEERSIARELRHKYDRVSLDTEEYKYMYKNTPLEEMLNYIKGELVDKCYKLYKDMYKEAYDNDATDLYINKMHALELEKSKIESKYKFGAGLKKSMRKIESIENFDDILTEANYYIGDGLDLKSIRIPV